MIARDVMTTDVVSVLPDTTIPKIAQILLEKKISAVPVIDSQGTALGMVSEGDLIGRNDDAPDGRREWWLALLAEGTDLNPEFLACFRQPEKTARDVMSTPLITVAADTETAEVARLLISYRFKRLPVVAEGHVIGIVSRADVLRSVCNVSLPAAAAPPSPGILAAAVAALDEHFQHKDKPLPNTIAAVPSKPAEATTASADGFRHLVSAHSVEQEHHHDAMRKAADEDRQQTVRVLIGQHVADERWQTLLDQARQAAAQGEKEFLLLRFPSDVCSDGGRAINAPEADWPSSLRGVAAEIYLRWEQDLKPQGFHLTAQVLDFPGGFPGDIGLTLYWGE